MKAEDSPQVDARAEESGRNPGGAAPGAEANAPTHPRLSAELEGLMDAVVSRGNLMLAYEQYRATTPVCLMNRRMRNRTSGGVKGRRG